MLPAAAVMLLLVAAFTWLWLPRDRVALNPERIDGAVTSIRLGAWSMAALVGMVLAMEYRHAPLGAVLLLVLFALFVRSSLARIDWLLLLTFAAIFLGLGHGAELPLVRQALDRFDFSQPLTAYASGIVASQLISNVPATVLLLDRTHDAVALAVAVNVGGFGVAIGSLANLIALRLAKQPYGLRWLHLVSIPFLLVCAPLVYLVWRWLG
jgi:di/tricarboxylate transporter